MRAVPTNCRHAPSGLRDVHGGEVRGHGHIRCQQLCARPEVGFSELVDRRLRGFGPRGECLGATRPGAAAEWTRSWWTVPRDFRSVEFPNEVNLDRPSASLKSSPSWKSGTRSLAAPENSRFCSSTIAAAWPITMTPCGWRRPRERRRMSAWCGATARARASPSIWSTGDHRRSRRFARASLNDGHKETYELPRSTSRFRLVCRFLETAGTGRTIPSACRRAQRYFQGTRQLSGRRRPRHPHRRRRVTAGGVERSLNSTTRHRSSPVSTPRSISSISKIPVRRRAWSRRRHRVPAPCGILKCIRVRAAGRLARLASTISNFCVGPAGASTPTILHGISSCGHSSSRMTPIPASTSATD